MKLNQHPKPEMMYFVLPSGNEIDIPLHVVFNDAETAKAYINRFKTYGDAQIVECHLNPGFYTDITRDCYFILLNKYDDEHSIYIVNDLKRSEQAMNKEYFFKDNQFCIYLMASSEKEALSEAIEFRNKAIANNEVQINKE